MNQKNIVFFRDCTEQQTLLLLNVLKELANQVKPRLDKVAVIFSSLHLESQTAHG